MPHPAFPSGATGQLDELAGICAGLDCRDQPAGINSSNILPLIRHTVASPGIAPGGKPEFGSRAEIGLQPGSLQNADAIVLGCRPWPAEFVGDH